MVLLLSPLLRWLIIKRKEGNIRRVDDRNLFYTLLHSYHTYQSVCGLSCSNLVTQFVETTFKLYRNHSKNAMILLKWNKSSLMSRTHTWTTVSYWLVRNGEFTKVHTHHFRLHFHTTKHFTVIYTNDTADHFWYDNHVS